MYDVNSELQATTYFFGNENNPLLVIDQFFSRSEGLINEAEAGATFIAQKEDFYPGLRKPVAGFYPQQCLAAIIPLVKTTFGIGNDRTATMNFCAFSLATTPSRKLRPIQSVPHIDNPDPDQFAVVHYLCDERYGGTSFYRHRSTGFESISPTRMQDYFRTLKQQVMADGGQPPAYINGDTALFTRIHQVPMKFNRAVIYRCNQLHSGDIDPELGLSAGPRTGRLTINSFFHFAA